MLKKFSSGVTIAALAMSLALFVANPAQVRADDRSHCQHAVEKAEANLDRAIAKNGERSHEADDRRRDLSAERQRCWDKYHQWWNGKEHRWETEHNWDADDHR
jgi:hypothetical protein